VQFSRGSAPFGEKTGAVPRLLSNFFEPLALPGKGFSFFRGGEICPGSFAGALVYEHDVKHPFE